MRIYLTFLFISLLLACSSPSSTSEDTTTIEDTTPSTTKYEEAMDWLEKHSNEYSGILNPRQTWTFSYDGYQVTDQYYWDKELLVEIQFDIRNIKKAAVENRFTNSVVLYPKKNEQLKVTRHENGTSKKIDGEYYSLMISPEERAEALRKVEAALAECAK